MENEQTSGRLAEVIKSTEAQREIWNSAIDVAAKECGFQSLAGGKKDVHEEYRRGCKDCLMAVNKLKDYLKDYLIIPIERVGPGPSIWQAKPETGIKIITTSTKEMRI